MARPLRSLWGDRRIGHRRRDCQGRASADGRTAAGRRSAARCDGHLHAGGVTTTVKVAHPPEIAAELHRLADGSSDYNNRDEHEALQPILRRLVAIERALGLREKIEAPRATRQRPPGS